MDPVIKIKVGWLQKTAPSINNNPFTIEFTAKYTLYLNN